jgi:hypothetical protein
LDDLDHLPVMQNIKIAAAVTPPISLDLPPGKPIIEGQRNDTLWRYCMVQAHHCDDLETLLDVAGTRNEDCLSPLDDEKVVKIAESAWGYTITGQNRFGQTGSRIRAAEVTGMAASNPYAFALLEYLRVHNGPDRTFIVANALAETLGWTRERFVKARDCLEGSHLEMVRKYSKKNGPAWYRWRRLRWRSGLVSVLLF